MPGPLETLPRVDRPLRQWLVFEQHPLVGQSLLEQPVAHSARLGLHRQANILLVAVQVDLERVSGVCPHMGVVSTEQLPAGGAELRKRLAPERERL